MQTTCLVQNVIIDKKCYSLFSARTFLFVWKLVSYRYGIIVNIWAIQSNPGGIRKHQNANTVVLSTKADQNISKQLIMRRFIKIHTVCHSVLSFDWDSCPEQLFWPDSKMEESTSETQGWKGLCHLTDGSFHCTMLKLGVYVQKMLTPEYEVHRLISFISIFTYNKADLTCLCSICKQPEYLTVTRRRITFLSTCAFYWKWAAT